MLGTISSKGATNWGSLPPTSIPFPARPSALPLSQLPSRSFSPRLSEPRCQPCVKLTPALLALPASSDPFSRTSYLSVVPHVPASPILYPLSFYSRLNDRICGTPPPPRLSGSRHKIICCQTDNPPWPCAWYFVLGREIKDCPTTLPPKRVSWAPGGPCLVHFPFP